jgi:hypothetical protein
MNCLYCGKPLHGVIWSPACDQCRQTHTTCKGCREAPLAIRGTLPNVTLHVKKCPPPILPKKGRTPRSKE